MKPPLLAFIVIYSKLAIFEFSGSAMTTIGVTKETSGFIPTIEVPKENFMDNDEDTSMLTLTNIITNQPKISAEEVFKNVFTVDQSQDLTG